MFNREDGIYIIVIQKLPPLQRLIKRLKRNVLKIRVPPDKGNRTLQEHALVMVTILAAMAYQQRDTEEQLERWEIVQRQVNGVVSALRLEDKSNGQNEEV